MFKLAKTINALASFFILLLVSSTSVYALPTCTMRTAPTPLLSNATSAKFIVNVTNKDNFDSYKMEFQCGINNNKDTAIKEPGSAEISRTLTNSGPLGTSGCEFEGGINATHTIKVIAIAKNNAEVDQCFAVYPVIDADTQCNLSVSPTSGIGSDTPITVSGTNLVKDSKMVLFFDQDAIDFPNNPAGRIMILTGTEGNVQTPSFSSKKIPQELMTPGTHTVSLRRRSAYASSALLSFLPLNPQFAVNLGAVPEKNFFELPFCPVAFTVTNDRKGSVLVPGANPVSITCTDPDKCALSGGKVVAGCNDTANADNPAISTAIGCIHTSPAALVKDVSTFAIGIGGGIAFLMMLLGAFQMLTSAGNPEALQAGRERLTSAIVGLLFVIFAVLLLQVIGVDILQIPGFKR